MVARRHEAGPVGRPPCPGGIEIGRRTGPGPGGAQREAGAVGRCVDDRAIVAVFERHPALAATGHRHRLGDAGNLGAGRQHDQILLVGVEDGQRPADIIVVAKADAGQRRFAGAGDIEPRRFEMADVAQRRHAVFPVRIAGQDRPAGGRSSRRDHPVVGTVAAFRVGGIGKGDDLLAIEHHPGGAEIIIAEHIGRDAAGVQPLGQGQLVRRAERAAQRFELHIAAAQRPGARHFAGEVAGQRIGTDAHHVIGAPQFGNGAGRAELHRQRLAAGAGVGNKGIDAGGESNGPVARFGGVVCPFGGKVAAIEQQPAGAILRDEFRPETRRQPPQPALAPQVYLPQAVTRDGIALQEKRIAGTGGADVRDAPMVDYDAAGGGKAGQGAAFLPHGGRDFGVCGGNERRQQQQRQQAFHRFPPGQQQPVDPDRPPLSTGGRYSAASATAGRACGPRTSVPGSAPVIVPLRKVTSPFLMVIT